MLCSQSIIVSCLMVAIKSFVFHTIYHHHQLFLMLAVTRGNLLATYTVDIAAK